jgi:hypothetical protein
MQDTLRAHIVLAVIHSEPKNEISDQFASSGNQVFISAIYFEDTVLEILHETIPQRIDLF